MTGSGVIAVIGTVIAAGMAIVVLYLAVRGTPGMVGLAPPHGSPRWPIYGFFVPWFIAGFLNARTDNNRLLLWIRMAEFLVVLAAFIISWRRAKGTDPAPPPRIT